MDFKVRRRAPGKVPSSIRLDHGDLLVMDGSAQSEYAHARCPGCRVLGLTLLIVGSHNTLRPVRLQAWWVVFSQRVCKVEQSRVPKGWEKGENKWSSFL